MNIRINCDIGERGPDHPVDLALMETIQIANIACGGHAGDAETVGIFRTLAEKNRVAVSAHLSYPDTEHFGRISMDMAWDDLEASLDRQMALLSGVTLVKFHGGLYHDAASRADLAMKLARWLKKKTVDQVIAPHGSEIMKACLNLDLEVLKEAFAERRYQVDPATSRPVLMDRRHPMAVIDDVNSALAQCLTVIRYGFVDAFSDDGKGGWIPRKAMLPCDTLCVHSDSPMALTLAQNLAKTLRNERPVHD